MPCTDHSCFICTWKELEDKRHFYWQHCNGLTKQPGSNSLTWHHNFLKIYRLLTWVCVVLPAASFDSILPLHLFVLWLFSSKLHQLPMCTFGLYSDLTFVQLGWCLESRFNALLTVSFVCLIGNILGDSKITQCWLKIYSVYIYFTRFGFRQGCFNSPFCFPSVLPILHLEVLRGTLWRWRGVEGLELSVPTLWAGLVHARSDAED